MQEDLMAAVDLGSNSFHLTIARLAEDQPRVLDRLRERVALASGLGPGRELSSEARERALATLGRFGQRLRDIAPERLRAVGTFALRRARNIEGFLVEAEHALGHAIEIISGAEEARLVYLGVARDRPRSDVRRLVVDIGGGSTECILGAGYEAQTTDSLSMGCVSFSQRFFPDGIVSAKGYAQALLAAHLEFETMEQAYRAKGWDECVGSSGTILSIEGILRASDWLADGIALKGLRKIERELVQAGDMATVQLAGLAADRREVLPGGLAILQAAFEALHIERMDVSQGALRDGVLYDLLGRLQHADVRHETIQALCQRYQVSSAQAERVESTALALFDAVAADWKLAAHERQMLGWAARLHEIGLTVAYSGYHKHGAYLATYGTLNGFSREDQELLATLIRTQRGKLGWNLLRSVRGLSATKLLALAVLLRLAVRLNRSRTDAVHRPSEVRAKTEPLRLRLRFPDGWLAEHPLTQADLEEEVNLLGKLDFGLRIG